jgi:lytic murein transglycosylase
MRPVICILLALCLWAPLASGAGADGFQRCVAALKAAARRQGISRKIVEKALAIDKPDPKIIRASRARPEFKTPIWDYLAFLVDKERVRDGQAMMKKHAAVLRRAQARFGVSRFVIAAVWGVESDYGRQQGRSFIPHAMATLICTRNPRRRLWRGQLFAALSLVQRGDLKLSALYGSWASAFGQTQFIPTTYRKHAVDFDGDGRRDLVGSISDALGSTANFLRRAGWRPGQPWMVEVKAPAGYRGPAGRKHWARLRVWARRGLRRADRRPLAGNRSAALLLPAGAKGPGFLVFRNFNVIYAYNHAESYGLAISQLAHRLAGSPALRTPWPTDDPGLSRAQARELQRRLLARGHKIGKVDGRIGTLTRAAIRLEQTRLRLKPTGRAGLKIYTALGGR